MECIRQTTLRNSTFNRFIMRITKIEQQKRRKNRRSIYLDGEYFFSADEEVVGKLGLAEGDEVTEDELKDLLFEEDKRKAKEYALNLLTIRPRSEEEVRSKLVEKGYEASVITPVIESLKRVSLIDDTEFARTWIKDRMATRPRGRAMLVAELKRKGLKNETINSALEEFLKEYDETKIVKEIAQKRLKTLKGQTRYVKKRRLFGYLARRGFSIDIINEVLNNIC